MSLIHLDTTHLHPVCQLAAQDPQGWSQAQWALSLSSDRVFGWMPQQTLQGLLVLAANPIEDTELLYLLVDAGLRRQGLGRQLLQHAIELARTDKSQRLLLEVRASNLPARQLYQQAGFIEDGIRRHYYRNALGQREDAVLMSLQLAAL